MLEENDPEGFRLLKLLPGKSSDKIRCETIHISLKDEPNFEAISYSWQIESPPVEIECDKQTMTITENLAAALRVFRLEDSVRLIWVDALCIDQSSTGEKNHQVPMMGNIFRAASIVQIWLGQDTSDGRCKHAFSLFTRLKQICATLGPNVDLISLAHQRALEKHGLPDIGDPAWRCIRDLLNRSWLAVLGS